MLQIWLSFTVSLKGVLSSNHKQEFTIHTLFIPSSLHHTFPVFLRSKKWKWNECWGDLREIHHDYKEDYELLYGIPLDSLALLHLCLDNIRSIEITIWSLFWVNRAIQNGLKQTSNNNSEKKGR